MNLEEFLTPKAKKILEQMSERRNQFSPIKVEPYYWLLSKEEKKELLFVVQDWIMEEIYRLK